MWSIRPAVLALHGIELAWRCGAGKLGEVPRAAQLFGLVRDVARNIGVADVESKLAPHDMAVTPTRAAPFHPRYNVEA